MESGTVCAIGDDGYWFYFGGATAAEENPEEYLRKVPIEDVVSEVFAELEDFRKNHDTFGDEYAYYAAILDSPCGPVDSQTDG